MRRPNFFIIGAPKCGTTSLVEWLNQHPEVYFSPTKEPHFFNNKDELWLTRDLDAYNKLFQGASDKFKAVGEGSTWYLFSPEAVLNIEKYTGGDAKYIVCLRNPVEMAYSLHSEMHVNGNEPESDFEKAWRMQTDRAAGKFLLPLSIAPSHLQYRQCCALGTMLKRVYDTVPTERITVIFLEDMASDPKRTVHRVAEFLGISKDFRGIDWAARNSAKRPRLRVMTWMTAVIGAAKRALGIEVGFGLLHRLKRWNTIEAKRTVLRSEFRAELVEAFAPQVDLLETLTGRSLEHWRR